MVIFRLFRTAPILCQIHWFQKPKLCVRREYIHAWEQSAFY